MINFITKKDGHKVAQQVKNREEYLALRNSESNVANVTMARMGNADAKMRLVQFAYNDLMPDGKVAGCCHPSDCFFHDIDCYDQKAAEEVKERILSMKDAIGLLMLERSVNGGWHLVCRRERGKTILENQVRIARKLNVEMDTNCHDLSRVVFSTTGDAYDLAYLDDALFEQTISVEESEQEYQLLKERVREGLEELPEGARHDSKHYCPQEVGEPATKSAEAVGKQAESAEKKSQEKYLDNYHGFKYEDIIKKYWELNNHGYEPTVGDRDVKTFELAFNLRGICGNNFEWLDQVIPCYNGFTLEEKRAKISSALKCKYEGIPLQMRKVLDAIEGTTEGEEETEAEAEKVEGDLYFNLPHPPALPKRLPKLIRLLTSKTPDIYKPAVASAVFPSLGAHLYKTEFKYTDNVLHEATLMDCLMAESGSGKGCIDAPIDHIMADIRERDALNEQREKEWKDEVNSKGANKDKSKRPEGLIIQEIHGDMTNPALVLRTQEAEDHFLYVKLNEVQMFDALKGNGKTGHQFMVMCLSFDPGNRYGQTRVGTQSITGTVRLRFNWNACTTINKGKKYFRYVVTDGPVQRVCFSTIPEREIGAEQLVYGKYDATFDEALRPFINNLCAARGVINCPQAFNLAKKLQKECQDLAVLSQSRVLDNLSHRACVIAWLKACVLYVANGCKWEKSIEDFVRWSLQNDLWCKMNFFGEMILADSEEHFEKKRGPQNMLLELPDEFTRDDLRRLRLKKGMSEKGTDEQARQWVCRGFVTVVTENTYRKLVYRASA